MHKKRKNAHAPRAKAPRARRRAPDPAALVRDPEKLLAALEEGESRLRHAPEPTERRAAPALLAERARPVVLPLRGDETALTTASGALVIRRRRAA